MDDCDGHLVDKDALIKTKTNYPATLCQLAGKKVLLAVISIMEFINSNRDDLCLCHKYLGCPARAHYENRYIYCEVCQIITDYSTKIDYRTIKSFLRLSIDIFKRKELIFKELNIGEENLRNSVFVHDDIIDEYLLFTE